MLNNNKIRIMTNLARFEKGKGKEDIKNSRFYKMDYMRYNILKSVVCATTGYLLILVLVGLYNLEYIIQNATKINYRELGTKAIAIYVVLLMIYIFCTILIASKKYDKSKKRIAAYSANLKELREIYKEENSL